MFVKRRFRFVVYSNFFFLQLQKGFENTKKTRRYSKEEIKKELIDSIVISDVIETEELNEKVDKVEKREDAAAVIRVCEDIIRTKKGYPIHRTPTRKRFLLIQGQRKFHQTSK